MECASGKYQVGYWMSDMKGKRLNIDEFAKSFKSNDIEFVKLSLDVPIEKQGHFDAIVHKLSDVVVKAEAGCQVSQRQIQNVYSYLAGRPNLIVIDQFENIRPILNRFVTYRLLSDFIASSEFSSQIFVPPFVQLDSMDMETANERLAAAGIRFPVLCKSVLSHGFDSAHEMSLVFEAAQLDKQRGPCVVQQFVNHGATLFKTFTVGEATHTAVRRSVRDLEAGPFATLHFSTSDVSKENSESPLTGPSDGPTPTADFDLLLAFTAALRRAVGLSLIGLDFIYDSVSMRYGVIDLNAFPGYERFPNFFDALLCVLRSKLAAATATANEHSNRGCPSN